MSRPTLWGLWLLACAVLLASIFTFELKRAQEARVMETSRTMLGAPLHRWMVPLCNGEVRLKKPPLAYWITAAAYRVLGVSEHAARLPAVLCSALTLAMVYQLGRGLFNQRAGLLAAGLLLGSFLFFRFGRYAETDTYSLAFIALAVWALHQASLARPYSGRMFLLMHLAGVGIGLCVMVKGLQAAFPILFLIALCISLRSAAPARRFLLSGAALTVLLLSLPWFFYVLHYPDASVMAFELKTIATGRNHGRPIWEYFGTFLEATLPWVGLVILALAAAVPRFKHDPALRLLILFGSLMFIVLSLTPQKQDHYFLPMLLPLVLTTGWMLDRALGDEDPKLTRAARWVLAGTLMVTLAGAPALLVAGRLTRRHLHEMDFVLAAAVALASAGALLLLRRRGLEAALRWAIPWVVLTLALVLGPWQESLSKGNLETMSRVLHEKYRDAEWASIGSERLAVAFFMRRHIPAYPRLEDVPLQAHGREVLILSEIDPHKPLPGQELERFEHREGNLGVFRRLPPRGAGLTQAPAPR